MKVDATPFRPCGIYYADSDRYEIIVRDAATITVPIPDSDVYWLQDMQTREIVGMGVNFASATSREEILRALSAGRCSYCGAVAYGVTPSDCERPDCNYVDANIEQQADAVMDLVAARPRAPVAPLSPVEREEVLRAVDIAISLIDDDADGQWLDVDTVERELKALAARLRSPVAPVRQRGPFETQDIPVYIRAITVIDNISTDDLRAELEYRLASLPKEQK